MSNVPTEQSDADVVLPETGETFVSGDGTVSEVLEDATDPNKEPNEDEVREYAEWLGMKLPEDHDYLWIARKGLRTPMPREWRPCQTDKGDIYYFNFKTGSSSWDHPMDDFFRKEFEREKARKPVPGDDGPADTTDADARRTGDQAEAKEEEEEEEAHSHRVDHTKTTTRTRKKTPVAKMKKRGKEGETADTPRAAEAVSPLSSSHAVSSTSLSPLSRTSRGDEGALDKPLGCVSALTKTPKAHTRQRSRAPSSESQPTHHPHDLVKSAHLVTNDAHAAHVHKDSDDDYNNNNNVSPKAAAVPRIESEAERALEAALRAEMTARYDAEMAKEEAEVQRELRQMQRKDEEEEQAMRDAAEERRVALQRTLEQDTARVIDEAEQRLAREFDDYTRHDKDSEHHGDDDEEDASRSNFTSSNNNNNSEEEADGKSVIAMALGHKDEQMIALEKSLAGVREQIRCLGDTLAQHRRVLTWWQQHQPQRERSWTQWGESVAQSMRDTVTAKCTLWRTAVGGHLVPCRTRTTPSCTQTQPPSSLTSAATAAHATTTTTTTAITAAAKIDSDSTQNLSSLEAIRAALAEVCRVGEAALAGYNEKHHGHPHQQQQQRLRACTDAKAMPVVSPDNCPGDATDGDFLTRLRQLHARYSAQTSLPHGSTSPSHAPSAADVHTTTTMSVNNTHQTAGRTHDSDAVNDDCTVGSVAAAEAAAQQEKENTMSERYAAMEQEVREAYAKMESNYAEALARERAADADGATEAAVVAADMSLYTAEVTLARRRAAWEFDLRRDRAIAEHARRCAERDAAVAAAAAASAASKLETSCGNEMQRSDGRHDKSDRTLDAPNADATRVAERVSPTHVDPNAAATHVHSLTTTNISSNNTDTNSTANEVNQTLSPRSAIRTNSCALLNKSAESHARALERAVCAALAAESAQLADASAAILRTRDEHYTRQERANECEVDEEMAAYEAAELAKMRASADAASAPPMSRAGESEAEAEAELQKLRERACALASALRRRRRRGTAAAAANTALPVQDDAAKINADARTDTSHNGRRVSVCAEKDTTLVEEDALGHSGRASSPLLSSSSVAKAGRWPMKPIQTDSASAKVSPQTLQQQQQQQRDELCAELMRWRSANAQLRARLREIAEEKAWPGYASPSPQPPRSRGRRYSASGDASMPTSSASSSPSSSSSPPAAWAGEQVLDGSSSSMAEAVWLRRREMTPPLTDCESGTAYAARVKTARSLQLGDAARYAQARRSRQRRSRAALQRGRERWVNEETSMQLSQRRNGPPQEN